MISFQNLDNLNQVRDKHRINFNAYAFLGFFEELEHVFDYFNHLPIWVSIHFVFEHHKVFVINYL